MRVLSAIADDVDGPPVTLVKRLVDFLDFRFGDDIVKLPFAHQTDHLLQRAAFGDLLERKQEEIF